MELLDDPSFPPDLSLDDLPLWMRQTRRRLDWGIILALLLGALSVWPFITRGGLPHGTALELHVYRAAEMADIVRDGVLYPRWAPDFLYGYGLPLFNYAAPASTALATFFQLVTESDAVDGVRFVLVTAALAGTAGMYAFVRRRWGPVAGLVATATYVLSPAVLFYLPYRSGDLSLMLALHLTPVVLWAVDRALYVGSRWDTAIVAGTGALLLLADERTAPWLFLMVVGWLLWTRIWDRACQYRPAWVGMVLGIGLSAVFWYPALAERHLVSWTAVGTPEPSLPLILGELLSPSAAMDMGAFNPAARRNLGLVLWLFALGSLLGLLAIMRWRVRYVRRWLHEEDGWWLYFALLSGGLFVLIAFHALSLSPVQQLALLTLVMAITAGRMSLWLSWQRHNWQRSLGLALLVGLPILNALPTLVPPSWPSDFGDTDAPARLQLELDEYSLASIPPGDPIPLPFSSVPAPSRRLVESYFSGAVDPVDRTTILPGQVNVVGHAATSVRLLVRAPTRMILPLYISAFDGWRAEIDSQEVPLTTSDDGRLQVLVPAGVHDVLIHFGDTAARGIGWGLSLLALFGLVAVTFGQREGQAADPAQSLLLLSVQEARIVGAILGALFLALPALVGRPGVFWLQSPRGMVLERGTALQRYTQAGIDILAYDLAASTVGAGDTLDLTLYWRAVRPPADNFQVTVSLINASNGQRAAQSYKRHVGGYPTTRWPMNRYVRDQHLLSLPADVSRGTYLLLVELWQCQTAADDCRPGQRLEFFGERGISLGRELVLPVLVTIP